MCNDGSLQMYFILISTHMHLLILRFHPDISSISVNLTSQAWRSFLMHVIRVKMLVFWNAVMYFKTEVLKKVKVDFKKKRKCEVKLLEIKCNVYLNVIVLSF